MSTPRRPEDEKKRLAAFLRQLPAAIEEMTAATEELLASGWEESFRRRAYNLATALTESCSAHKLPQAAGLARSVASLLRLPLEEVIPLEDALEEKLGELLTLLRELGADVERGTG